MDIYIYIYIYVYKIKLSFWFQQTDKDVEKFLSYCQEEIDLSALTKMLLKKRYFHQCLVVITAGMISSQVLKLEPFTLISCH